MPKEKWPPLGDPPQGVPTPALPGSGSRVFRVPRETLSLAPTAALVGSPNSFKFKASRPEGQPAKFFFHKKSRAKAGKRILAVVFLHQKLS
jgi:hypothetical protein